MRQGSTSGYGPLLKVSHRQALSPTRPWRGYQSPHQRQDRQSTYESYETTARLVILTQCGGVQPEPLTVERCDRIRQVRKALCAVEDEEES